LRGYRVLQQVAACREWRRGAIPAGFHEPVTSSIPMLLISGPHDPVTPPVWAERIAARLPRSLHVIVPDGHHGGGGLSHIDCLLHLQAAFLERGTGDGLDTSCVAAMKRPPFIVDAAGFEALVASGDE
jgi:pimeloyl-ACP methyl ester carboxylesterase